MRLALASSQKLPFLPAVGDMHASPRATEEEPRKCSEQATPSAGLNFDTRVPTLEPTNAATTDRDVPRSSQDDIGVPATGPAGFMFACRLGLSVSRRPVFGDSLIPASL